MQKSTQTSSQYSRHAAEISLPPGIELAVTVDTLVCGIHFPEDTSPIDIGHKALAVNISDLAAMGATPDWAVISLTLPSHTQEDWYSQFHLGLDRLAKRYGIRFLLGERGEGPLAITLQIYGHIPYGQALRRDSARSHDLIFVTGTLGDAGLALSQRFSTQKIDIPKKHRAFLSRRLARPTPRIAEGILLREIATAAIDISDGLAADLGHICEESGLGAIVEVERLPLSHALRQIPERKRAWQLALSSGDDYELCFTVPPTRYNMLMKAAQRFSCPITRIGHMVQNPPVRILHRDGKVFSTSQGYRHFTE
uniref:Thiamine-monophosphate kinase n=1 Tax=Candidatus Kentrum sp. MB TaxID=2138164 RepID=A0A450XHT4_9GAMM|nr:MAG: thiamine-phosphate kinase [Candidatus Kentron sp. MB]VFK34064.1 MAG: thiamine-phosphate kinase [Candidatus Kentron sp. MB]VFK76566.1 MAG: thiamine-phosphate kinase [Candidatus Kentron sp. MB]